MYLVKVIRFEIPRLEMEQNWENLFFLFLLHSLNMYVNEMNKRMIFKNERKI